MKNGDRNTNFFHRYASRRRRENAIRELEREDGSSTTNPKEMEAIAKKYFSTLFTSTRRDKVIRGLKGVSKYE